MPMEAAAVSHPLVSIVIPTFNRKETLLPCIESALAQDYPNLEVVISDNASTDGTEEAVQPLLDDTRLKYYRNQTNLGMVRNWQRLLYEYCSGEWFLLLSDDDWFIDHTYISRAISMALEDKSVVLAYASGYVCTDDGERQEMQLPYSGVVDGARVFLNRDRYAKPIEFMLCTVLFQTALAKSLNAFSNSNNLNCDSELFLHSCLCGNVAVLNEPVACYRFTSSSLSLQKRSAAELVACADTYAMPYAHAVRAGHIAESDLKQWKARVLMPYLRYLVARLFLEHRSEFLGAFRKLEQMSGGGLLQSCLQVRYLADVLLLHFPAVKRLWKGAGPGDDR